MLNHHDQTSHFISEMQIKETLYRRSDILNQAERELLKEEISAARVDGKISAHKLHKVLKSLREQKKISQYDQKAAEESFEDFFGKE